MEIGNSGPLERWPALNHLAENGVAVDQFAHGWRAMDSAIVASLATWAGWKVLAIRRLRKSPWITGAMERHGPELFTLFHWRRQLHCDFAIQTGSIASGGSGIVVLDFDKPETDPEIAALLAKLGRGETVEVLSGRKAGGFHLYYRIPDGLEFKNQQKLWGLVDVRGYHGLAVMPGSDHKSGTKYIWADGRAPDEVEVLPLPTGWVEALPQRGEQPTRTVRSGPHVRRSGKERRQHDESMLIGDGVGYGGFNSPLYRNAIRYFQQAGTDVPLEPLLQALREIITEAPKDPGRDVSRYMSGSDLPRIIERARAFVKQVKGNGSDDRV